MIAIRNGGVYIVNGDAVVPDEGDAGARVHRLTGKSVGRDEAAKATIAARILDAHNTADDPDRLKIRFDALTSPDNNCISIIQTARASGMEAFPLPYVLTNCHNSLCAIGGTINEDDHMFSMTAAKKYGGIYVPMHMGVIHQYMRETMAGCGKMILGSDSHTRYGALGTMGIGEGGGEVAKHLLGRTYDIARPPVVAVMLRNRPVAGVGPHDVALALVGAVFASGFAKNKVLEFLGDGVGALPVEYRNGIDVMSTETACLSSIWCTDEQVERYLADHGRKDAYARLEPGDVAYYDGLIDIDLAAIKPMIALPFHPSNVVSIEDLKANAADIFAAVDKETRERFGYAHSFSMAGKIRPAGIHVDQGVIGGCAGGTFLNIAAAADVLRGRTPGNGRFSLSVYPASQPINIGLAGGGITEELMNAGAIMRAAFCGPCFGAGDIPANGALSIRHATRNYPNREGAKPGNGQLAAVALMDARSVAATAARGGVLTAATELDVEYREHPYRFNGEPYRNRVYQGFGKPDRDAELQFGPNIADWPTMPGLGRHLLLKITAFIDDSAMTTDDLTPSGDASSYRSNPLKLAEFTLVQKVPDYVNKCKAIQSFEVARRNGGAPKDDVGFAEALEKARACAGGDIDAAGVCFGSAVYADSAGDGSAREQAASSQKVLGGYANIAHEYATKRYRSNLINWGLLPFVLAGDPPFGNDSFIFVPEIKAALEQGKTRVAAYCLDAAGTDFSLELGELSADERRILVDGCLINFYKNA